MTDDIYKAPEAELQVDNSDVDEFFIVSTGKLWIMHVLTFGLYDFYWFYRHWDHMKRKHSLSVTPMIRSVFFVFFVYSTFKKIQLAAEARQLGDGPNLRILGLVWYIVLIGQIGLTFLFAEAIAVNPLVAPALALLVSILWGFIFVAAQRKANRVVDDPEGRKNGRITAVNVVWIVVSVLFEALSIIGSYPPAD